VTRDPGPFLTAFLRSTALIARAHLVRTLTSRRFLACAIVAFLPALVAFLVTSASARAGPGHLAANLGWMILLQIVVPLVTLIAGSAVVAEEIEDRTITYVFTRPIPRASLLFGRWITTTVLITALLWLATFALLAACARARGKGTLDDTIKVPLYGAVLWGGVVYSALFASLGAFFKHPMLVGIGYAFAVEGFLANLPGNNQALAIQYYLRSLIAQSGAHAWQRVEGFTDTKFQTPERAHTTLAIVLVLALLLGAWRLSTREYELTS
jgi:ABC-type transport system involved in multi-copper enzyme maturation permease subunit